MMDVWRVVAGPVPEPDPMDNELMLYCVFDALVT